MLSIGAKKYLEDSVKEQFQELNKNENSNLSLSRKINALDKFFEVYKENPKYKETIESLVEEIERVAREEGMISFYKIAKVEMFFDILAELKKIDIRRKLQ